MLAIPALRQFFKTKNTIVLIKPANSLQTTGIYSLTRNPMYLSLMLMYLGMAFIFGNWWTLFLAPGSISSGYLPDHPAGRKIPEQGIR